MLKQAGDLRTTLGETVQQLMTMSTNLFSILILISWGVVFSPHFLFPFFSFLLFGGEEANRSVDKNPCLLLFQLQFSIGIFQCLSKSCYSKLKLITIYNDRNPANVFHGNCGDTALAITDPGPVFVSESTCRSAPP